MTGIPFAVFVGAALVILGVFAAVARSGTGTVDYAKATRLRLLFLLALGVVLIVFFALTIPGLPYPLEARTPERVFHSVGKQYAWSLTDVPGPTLAAWDREFSPTVTVPAGAMLEFRGAPPAVKPV